MNTKRLKVALTSGDITMQEPPSASINDLPNDLLQHCFSFISGQYITIGPVSKQFYSNYSLLGIHETTAFITADMLLKIGSNRMTTADAVANDLQLTEYCFILDAPMEFMQRVCYNAFIRGRTDIVECAFTFGLDAQKFLSGEKLLYKLAEDGNLEMIEFFLFQIKTKDVLRRDRHMLRQSICEIAAKNGHFDVLKKYGPNTFYNIDVEQAVIQFGDLDTLKWCVKERGGSLSKRDQEIIGMSAAKIGNIEVLEYIRENSSDYFHEIFHADYAAMSGSIKMLEFCQQNNFSFSEYACDCALQNNDKDQALKTLQWLRNHNCPWDERTCHSAVEYDNLAALKWAKSQGCPWDEYTIALAAGNHNISILEYCFENGCPMSTEACEFTMRMGLQPMERKYQAKALETLKCLREHSCPWDEQTLKDAAYSRNFEAMIWAKNNGCPWHSQAYYLFIREGNTDVVEDCLQTHGQQDTDEAFRSALCYNSNVLEVIQKLKLLRKYGYSWNENVCASAAANDHMRVLQWLKHMGCPWDAKTCEYAVINGNLSMLKYAHENGCDLSKEAYAYCFDRLGLRGYFDKIPTNPKSSHIEILEYLQENDCPVPNDDEWKLSPNGVPPFLLRGLECR